MPNKIETITTKNFVMRIERPDGIGPFPIFLLLHGWTGNESSMSVFTPRLLKNALFIAPRGLYKTIGGGYSWHPDISSSWPEMDDFIPAIQTIVNTITKANFPDGNFSEMHIVGFSQGAALGYCLAAMYPDRVATLAGLSGFLPDGASAWQIHGRLRDLPVFIAHGSEDELVPVERARKSVQILQDAGASVIYCEDTVGHKLSAKCFRGLEAFYEKINC